MGSLPRGHDGEWLDFVADLLASGLTVWPDERVCRQLVRTFDAAGGVFHEIGATGEGIQVPWPPDHFTPYWEEQERWFHTLAPRRHPLLRYHLVTGRDDCLQCDDVPDGIADRRMQSDWRARGRGWGGVQAQLSLPVLFGPGGLRSFVLGRPDRYTAGEMATARRLHGLLRGLDRHISAYAHWSGSVAGPAHQAADAVHLTPRELVVLDLLASGLTAAAIARRLTIAERTVQKHLQRIYTKLDSHDRLTAVQRAQYMGLVPSPART